MNSSEQQLLKDLKEHFPDFRCVLNDLKNPTEEFVTSFYSYWLSEFNADISNIPQVQFDQECIVRNYQDAYSGIIPKANLLRCLRAFEVVPDLGMLDIIRPTPKRIQNIIRAFIDFFKWADHRCSDIFSKAGDVKERKDAISRLLKGKEDRREHLNSITKEIAAIQDEKAKLEKEVYDLQQKSSHLKAEKQKRKENIDLAHEKLREKQAILEKVAKEEAMLINKMKDFSTLVVDSPSSILSEMENVRLKAKELAELSDQKRDMVESKMQDHKKLESFLKRLQQKTQELIDLLKLIDQTREQETALSGNETATKTLVENLKELKSHLLAIQNKKRLRQETLQALHLQWTALKPQLTESVEAALRELNEKKGVKDKMLYNLKEDISVQEKIDSLIKEIKIIIDVYNKQYDQLLQQTEAKETFQRNLQETFENVLKDANSVYPNRKNKKKDHGKSN